MGIVERANLYRAEGIYGRELRPFIWKPVRGRRGEHRVPNTTPLEPHSGFEIYSGRDLFDSLQSTFGYFYGGGWIYGLIENSRFRAASSSIVAFADDDLRALEFRAGSVKGRPAGRLTWTPNVRIPQRIKSGKYLTVDVERDSFLKAGTLAKHVHLSELDQLSYQHDLDLRLRDERVWHDSSLAFTPDHKKLFEDANRKLREGLIKYRDGFGALRQEWRESKTQLEETLWEGMGSLIYYQMSLAQFGILALGAVDGVPGMMKSMSRRSIAGDELVSLIEEPEHVFYAPPIQRLSRKSKFKRATITNDIELMQVRGAEAQTVNILADAYETIQSELENEFLSEISKD